VKIPPRLRFVLGLLRHPTQVRSRLRELFRISAAPPTTKAIPTDRPVYVDVIPVTTADSLGEQLVKIYTDNPSPYVSGPTSLKKLTHELAEGTRYFLVRNAEGQAVGARAFETGTKRIVGSVTDFPFRGRGYQFSASRIMREQLAAEGFREFKGEVMRENTRQIRKLLAEGWEIETHPGKPHLVRCTMRLDEEE
jgi:hypothetical protein